MLEINKAKIHEALRYIHHWEARERGDQKISRVQATREVLSTLLLNTVEQEILLKAIHVTVEELAE